MLAGNSDRQAASIRDWLTADMARPKTLSFAARTCDMGSTALYCLAH